MSEILFRGKRKDNGEWVKGSFWDEIPGKLGGIAQYGSCCFHNVDLTTVGQFTWLTDKNGKKIFDGDILQSWSDYHQNYYYQGVVRYGEFNCSCCDGVYGWYLDGGDIRHIEDYEVCGNIHDNPELLEGK